MNFLLELWSIIVSSVMSWFQSIDNNLLNIIVNLLTILVISIGLIDWIFRKVKQSRIKKQEKSEAHKKNVLEAIEGTQKPFKAVKMLENPMETSEKMITIFEKFTKLIGGIKMKKFFKWVWYNKEQLLSIAYNVILIALANMLMFTDVLNGFVIAMAGTQSAIWVKVSAIVVAVLFTALTVRNVCVKYGLSSLDTIDEELAKRAEAAENKLTSAEKTTYKTYVSTLNETLKKAKDELATAESELARITALYNADNTLVADYVTKKQAYEKKIAANKAVVTNLEQKIADYKAIISNNVKVDK